jgi:hypothetical protein
MYRLFVILMALYFLGEPGMTFLSDAGVLKEVMVAVVLALIAMPWVATQFDN